jgi:hypothetical protein
MRDVVQRIFMSRDPGTSNLVQILSLWRQDLNQIRFGRPVHGSASTELSEPRRD